MTDRDIATLRVHHRFSASAERVYDAWLDPQKASKFLFATATGFIVRCEIDARVGGGFTIVDRRGGEDVAHTGTFLELERPRRIVFSFTVEKYSKDATRVSIEIAPLGHGCEVTITHALPARYAKVAKRTSDGWAKMLELAAIVVSGGPETCGEGLAQHASVPLKLADWFAALAETLELHRAMIVKSDADARAEDDAYASLASSYREIAARVQRAATLMTAARALPMPAHDESAFGSEQLGAFERYVGAQNALLSVLKIAAEQDQQMLNGMQSGET